MGGVMPEKRALPKVEGRGLARVGDKGGGVGMGVDTRADEGTNGEGGSGVLTAGKAGEGVLPGGVRTRGDAFLDPPASSSGGATSSGVAGSAPGGARWRGSFRGRL